MRGTTNGWLSNSCVVGGDTTPAGDSREFDATSGWARLMIASQLSEEQEFEARKQAFAVFVTILGRDRRRFQVYRMLWLYTGILQFSRTSKIADFQKTKYAHQHQPEVIFRDSEGTRPSGSMEQCYVMGMRANDVRWRLDCNHSSRIHYN
jgi:hypothetical protein